MDKKYFIETLGLSCIENYLIGILEYNCFESRSLFYDSYLPLGELVKCFTEKEMKYEHFTVLKRLQSIAIKEGFIEYQTVKTDVKNITDEICELIRQMRGESIKAAKDKLSTFFLLKAKKEFVFERFNYKNWREDHYLLVLPSLKRDSTDSEYICFNESTKSNITLKYSELEGVYDNEYVQLKVVKQVSEEDRVRMFDMFSKTVNNYKRNDINEKINSFKNLTVLRDLLLVYRVTRKRIAQYIELNYDTSLLDKYLFKVEYIRMRNEEDKNLCTEIMGLLEEFEEDFMQKVTSIVAARAAK